MKEDFEKIQWPPADKPILANQAAQERNRKMVEQLCSIGKVTRWIKNDNFPTEPGMPYYYNIDGVEVQFLPHWGGIFLGRAWVDDSVLPESEDELKSLIARHKKNRRDQMSSW